MNKLLQEHILKLDIHIKQINFHISLPVKVHFSVVADGKIMSEGRKKHTLEDQTYNPYERHSIELPVDYDAKKAIYRPKQVTINMNYEPDQGRSGSKTVKFDPFVKTNEQKQWALPIESNRDFKINFTTTYSFISKKAKPTINSDPFNFLSTKKDSNADKKGSVINQLIKTDSIKNSKKGSQVNGFQTSNFADKTRKLENVKSIPIQSKKHIPRNRMFSPRYGEESNQTTKVNEEIEKLRKKFEIEREEKVRSISKLKMEINPNFLGQLERKDKDEDTQTGKWKQKIRNYERKQKSYTMSIQQLNSELEKRKSKITQLQRIKEQMERTIGQKDIKLRSFQSTIRSLNEQLDNLTSKERVVSKKGEVKEVVLKDQMRKLEEKLKEAETQIFLANEQKNSIIKRLSQMERIHQGALKEKDSKYFQEKSQYFKFKEEFSEKEKQFTLIIQNLNEKLYKVDLQKNQAQERTHILQQTVFNYQSQILIFKQTLKKEREQSERKIQESTAKLTNDINSIRLKFNELTSESTSMREKLKRLQGSRIENEARIKELEDMLKIKTNQATKNISRINSLRQEADSANEDNNRKVKEIQNLKQNCANFKAKWLQTKQKAEEEKSRREEANTHLERQLSQFGKQRESYESEIKQLRWVIVSNNDNLSELQYEIKQLNNNSFKLSEQIMSKTQRLSTLEENLRTVQLQNEHYQKNKNIQLLKIKELTQALKIKSSELQDEKKLRVKDDQKLEEERERSKQYQNYSKERDSLEEERQKQKELFFIKKKEEIQSLQLQLTKQKQEIVGLKNSNQLILREIQLSKMDNDSFKGEYNILDSAFKTLKQQNSILTKTNESLKVNLNLSEQNSAVQLKKYQLLLKQFDQYKASIEKSLQNLLSQLFKEDASNSNVVAATLLPFPSQNLSNMQVELVQRRNNFIIKYRQRVSDLKNQIDDFENQIKELKQLLSNQEQAFNKMESEERDKLKGLLYENMLEKNNLNEELILQRKQREQLEKEIERLKGQIFKKQDLEQELHGQLQLLLIEYDGIKSQNQDLSSIIFKYKEQQIQSKSEFDQKLLILTQEAQNRIEKLNMEAFQKQRKIIQLQKDILEFNEKIRRLQTDKLKTNELLELSRQSYKISEDKVNNLNMQITKLHNYAKSLEKKEGNYRDVIGKLEAQFTQQINRFDLLQASMTRLTSDHFETNIQKEKIAGELANSNEKCTELEKMLQDKGEISKERIEKKIQENSQLKSNVIKLSSELELKEFYLSQKEQNNQMLTDQNQELNKSIATLKARVKQLVNIVDECESKLKDSYREVEQLIHERQRKEQRLGQGNFIITSLHNQIEEMSKLSEILQIKEKECIQLRQSKSESEGYYMGQLKKSKEIISDLKKQIKCQQENFDHLEEQYKMSIQSVSKANNQRYKYLESEFLQEKDDFLKRVQEIQTHNKRVISEFEYRIDKLREDLQQSKENQKMLTEQGNKKEQAMRSLSKRTEKLESQVDDYKQKYNRYYLLYQESKVDLQQNTKQYHNKMVSNMQESRVTQVKENVLKLKEFERKIDRLRHSQEMQLSSNGIGPSEMRSTLDRIFSKLSQLFRQSIEPWEGGKGDSRS